MSDIDVLRKIVDGWLNKIDTRQKLGIDSTGVGILDFLTETLLLVKYSVPTEQWNTIARFVLKKARVQFVSVYYSTTLQSLVPHVSYTICKQIMYHFVRVGDVGSAIIVATQLGRKITSEEIITMVEWHRSKNTSTESDAWGKLMSISSPDEITIINEVLETIGRHEEMPESY